MTDIATTHVGSLPRSQRTVDFLFGARPGDAYDERKRSPTCMAEECSRRRCAARWKPAIDIVSDGETSKISYSTYVKDRYTGFSGDSDRNVPGDLKLFPGYMQRIAREGGTPQFARPRAAPAPVASRRATRTFKADIANLKAGMESHGAERGFMNAASPGVIAQFLPNAHYPSREAYLEALADAMKPRVRRDPRGRARPSARLPRPRAVAARGVRRPLGRGVREDRGGERRGAEPCPARRGPRAGAGAHLLGQLRGAARVRHCARPCVLRPHVDPRRPRPVRERQPAPRPRVDRVPGPAGRDPGRHGPRARGHRLDEQLRGAPRAGGAADRAVHRDRGVGAGLCGQRTAASERSRASAPSTPTSPTSSSRPSPKAPPSRRRRA